MIVFPHRSKSALLAVLVGLLALGAAACGPAFKPSAGASIPATSSSKGVAFAACMRAHGIANFPDPMSSPPSNGHENGVVSFETPNGQIIFDLRSAGIYKSPQLNAALQVCQGKLGISGGPGQRITAQEHKYYLEAAACMRSHGFPNFPDPDFSGGNVTFHVPSSIDTHSTQYTQAVHTCQRLIPAGLPYSGSD